MKQVRYLQQLSANTRYFIKLIVIGLAIMLLSPQCMKREIIFQQEKPILISGTITVEDAIHFLNEKYPQYNTDSIQWQYAYIKEFDDGNSLLKVVWKEDYESPIFTDIIVWTNNDTMNGVLFEVYPDTNYLWEKKILLGEGHNTRYYVYDDDFTGVMVMGDLKTHELIEGRVYENGKIVGYIYPKTTSSSSTVKAVYFWTPPTMMHYKLGGDGSITGMLPNVTVYSSYGKGNGGSLGFPSTSFGGGISGGTYSGGSGGAGGLNGSQSSNTNSQRQAPTKTSCDMVRLLALSEAYKLMFNNLTVVAKDNIEYAYMYRKKGADYEMSFVEGNSNNTTLLIPSNNPIDGTIHTHPPKGNDIFSEIDIYSLVSMYNNKNMADPASFTVSVLTYENIYMLKIENLTLFAAFAEKYKNNEKTFYKDFERGGYDISSESIYERDFLQSIDDFNMGLRLYKTDLKTQNLSQWTSPSLSSDRKGIIHQDCK